MQVLGFGNNDYYTLNFQNQNAYYYNYNTIS